MFWCSVCVCVCSCRRFTSMAEWQPPQDGSRSFRGGRRTFPSPLWWTGSHPQVRPEGWSGDLLQEVSKLLSDLENNDSKCDVGEFFTSESLKKALVFLQVYQDRCVCSCNDGEQSRHHWVRDRSLPRPLQEHLLQVTHKPLDISRRDLRRLNIRLGVDRCEIVQQQDGFRSRAEPFRDGLFLF